MYKEVLRSIENAEMFALVVVVVFVIFFGLLFFYVMRMNRQQVDQISALPLDDAAPAVASISPNRLTPNA